MAINELLVSSPLVSLIVIAFAITLVITLVHKRYTNQGEMGELRERLKSLQGEMKENKDNEQRLVEIQKEVAVKNIEYMKHSFKPMFITFLPIIIIFWWIRKTFEDLGAIMSLPIIGGVNWLWTYIIFSMIFSIAMRKILKIH